MWETYFYAYGKYLIMDKRKIIAKNRYEEIHYELLEVGEKLLNTKRLTQISLNSINEYTNISKTTIYEHFHSFEEFLSDVIKHVYKKRRQSYLEKLQDEPKENIKTIFKVWTEFTYENFTLGKNIYAAYILLAGKYNFQLMGVYEDLDMELEKLGFSNKERKEFIGKFYFSIDELIIDLENENKNNINSKINDLIQYLDNY